MRQNYLFDVPARLTTEETYEEILHDMCNKSINGYPAGKVYGWTRINASVRPSMTIRIAVPYMKGGSEVAARILAKGDLFVAHKLSNTLRMQVTKVKDARLKEECAKVVYSIPCNDCNKRYLGESKGKLGTRMKEHFLHAN